MNYGYGPATSWPYYNNAYAYWPQNQYSGAQGFSRYGSNQGWANNNQWGGNPGNWGAGFGYGTYPAAQFGSGYGNFPYNPANYGTFPYNQAPYNQGGYGYGTVPYNPPGAGFGGYPWTPLSDEELGYFVENALDNDPIIPTQSSIGVQVNDGIVTLTGTVPNKRIKHAAGDDAWWIPQVIDVHNEIQVMPRRQRAGGQTRERTKR
jgi:hypothetical protein